jgi:hypothetical protein
MAGEMVAVCRSDGVFLILPIVAAAVRLRNQAVSDQATAAWVCRCSTEEASHVYDGMVKSSRGVGADLCSASDTLSQWAR